MSKIISSVSVSENIYDKVAEIKEAENRPSMSNTAATLIKEALEARGQKDPGKEGAAPPSKK